MQRYLENRLIRDMIGFNNLACMICPVNDPHKLWRLSLNVHDVSPRETNYVQKLVVTHTTQKAWQFASDICRINE